MAINDLTGQMLGKYRLDQEIGRGAMAVVYRATDTALNRQVALKVLPTYFSHDPEFVRRFQREARVAASLSHPGIVQIYDVGEAPEGTLYIAMQEAGETLKRLLQREGPLPLRRALAIAEQVVDYLLQGTARHAVNLPSVTPEVLALLSPYLVLAEKIGKFQAQVTPGRLQEVHISYSGSVVDVDTAMVGMSLLKGLLDPILEEKVNYVNAPILARERGIKVVESKSRESEDFTTLLTVQVQTDQTRNMVAGTLFGKNEPRLVRINEFVTEAVPEGHILFVHNQDQPGVIGNMGSTLASHGINIGQMHLSRDQVGGTAISLVHVDGRVSQEVLDALLRLPHILSVMQIEL